jgi:hypothetical protein
MASSSLDVHRRRLFLLENNPALRFFTAVAQVTALFLSALAPHSSWHKENDITFVKYFF